MNYHWYDFLGNIGVFLILLAYFLLQIDKIDNRSIKFSAINLFGALFICISLYYDFNLSAFIIEFSWLLISAMGIVKSLTAGKAKTTGVP
jgi:hypothetical protein